jgi:hypothetical protein
MWNSGGKASWETGGGRRGGYLDPFGIFSGAQSDASKKFEGGALSNANKNEADINALQQKLGGVSDTAWQSALDFNNKDYATSDQNLFDLMARRFRESTMPGLSARGLTTSGAGIAAEQKGIGDLATQFAGTSFDRDLKRKTLLQDAAKGVAVLNSLPIELRNALIQAMLGGQVAGMSKSILEQYGGGSGVSSMFNSGSSSGGGGSSSNGMGSGSSNTGGGGFA